MTNLSLIPFSAIQANIARKSQLSKIAYLISVTDSDIAKNILWKQFKSL